MQPLKQTEQEHLYHKKNELYLKVARHPFAQRNVAAYQAFMRMHALLQEHIRFQGDITSQDLSALEFLAQAV